MDGGNVILADRKSPRAAFHDYSGGDYFVTICTLGRAHYFGTIADGAMRLSPTGTFCASLLGEVGRHHPYAAAPVAVVMPNHIHAIIRIDGMAAKQPPAGTRALLGVVVGALKREVTLFARRNNIPFAWQRRYHDHIIRNSGECGRIEEYIRDNVARWAEDCFYT